MQARTQNHTDEFTRIAARIHNVIGSSVRVSKAESTHVLSNRNNRTEEMRRNVSQSPRMWNETLTFAADG